MTTKSLALGMVLAVALSVGATTALSLHGAGSFAVGVLCGFIGPYAVYRLRSAR